MIVIVTTVDQLDALPVDAAIIYRAPGSADDARPRLAAKNERGTWTFVGNSTDNDYRSTDLVEEGARIRVLFNPADDDPTVAPAATAATANSETSPQ